MRDPAVRGEDPVGGPDRRAAPSRCSTACRFAQMFRFGNPPNYEPKREDSVAAIAAREGRTPQEVAYDMLIEDDGRDFIYTPLVQLRELRPVRVRDDAGEPQRHHGAGRRRRACRLHPRRRLPDLAADLLGQAAQAVRRPGD